MGNQIGYAVNFKMIGENLNFYNSYEDLMNSTLQELDIIENDKLSEQDKYDISVRYSGDINGNDNLGNGIVVQEGKHVFIREYYNFKQHEEYSYKLNTFVIMFDEFVAKVVQGNDKYSNIVYYEVDTDFFIGSYDVNIFTKYNIYYRDNLQGSASQQDNNSIKVVQSKEYILINDEQNEIQNQLETEKKSKLYLIIVVVLAIIIAIMIIKFVYNHISLCNLRKRQVTENRQLQQDSQNEQKQYFQNEDKNNGLQKQYSKQDSQNSSNNEKNEQNYDATANQNQNFQAVSIN
ncbi:hypothetical protein PPERSA_12695 [Pseudocohnilembus persalinus]|uniref:Transmembrane protein n=1 Tax=Pseudocohnilembus persalinus TaxID=266149 RepID=A0A0V0QTM2_PSEPJ|nr:hypothetical protein PPERSA_12695 [Pseudocohnilembus persalinus]|eukprot:KRX05517.1 hypothetical protein PPERSA_12695 [Pseudocohnilembus persalinus]